MDGDRLWSRGLLHFRNVGVERIYRRDIDHNIVTGKPAQEDQKEKNRTGKTRRKKKQWNAWEKEKKEGGKGVKTADLYSSKQKQSKSIQRS